VAAHLLPSSNAPLIPFCQFFSILKPPGIAFFPAKQRIFIAKIGERRQVAIVVVVVVVVVVGGVGALSFEQYGLVYSKCPTTCL